MSTIQEPHCCRECHEVDKGFSVDEDDTKLCDECGGRVLSLQEASDYIAELRERVECLGGELHE